jgi:hypothetical protein
MQKSRFQMSGSKLTASLALALCAIVAAPGKAMAQSGWGQVRLDNWGFFQKNANESDQWQYRPRVFIPYKFDNDWTVQLRADVPLLYTDDSGPGNPAGNFSGGVGNILVEPIVDSPEVAPNLTLRASLRLVFPSAKPSPFGNDSQYQVAPLIGMSYRMPDTLRGVTISPFVRYFWGFDAREPNTTLVSSLNLFPNVSFGLGDQWSLALYPENPIVYNNNTNSWFVPFDFLFVKAWTPSLHFAIGGAIKLGNPANPSYNYIVDGRVTYFF